MKITLVIPFLIKGGAERVVADLANHAAAHGHEVTIVAAAPAPPEQMPTALDPAIDVRFVAQQGFGTRAPYRRLPAWLLRNRSWLMAQDVVHCHLTFGSVFGSLLQLLRSASRGRAPVVVETYHAVGMAIPNRNRALHAGLLGGRDAIAFMATDPFWAAFRTAHSKQLIETIPNGVSAPPATSQRACEQYRRSAGIPKGVAVIGSVGRLAPERRPDLLLRAFADLRRRSSAPVHLLLGGEGPERPRLEALARDLGIADAVHLPGLVINPADVFGVIDLYLTVNVGEITGVAALEAALTGLPIVAIQLVEGRRTHEGDWIWSTNDPVKLAEHAAELLGDRAKLKQLACRQQAYARSRFGVTTMADAYYRLYRRALARAR